MEDDDDRRAHLGEVGRSIAGTALRKEGTSCGDRTGEPGLAASAGGAGQPTGNATHCACDSRMLAV